MTRRFAARTAILLLMFVTTNSAVEAESANVRMAPIAAHSGAESREVARAFHDHEGFGVSTADEQFKLRIFGIVQTDFRDYLRKSDRTDYERFLVRRARLYVEGKGGPVAYRLMTDFGDGEPSLLDAFVDVELVKKAFRIRAGKYKQPFSYEQFKMEDLTLAVFERSSLDVLAPARNVGIMVHGDLDRFEYALGLSLIHISEPTRPY